MEETLDSTTRDDVVCRRSSRAAPIVHECMRNKYAAGAFVKDNASNDITVNVCASN